MDAYTQEERLLQIDTALGKDHLLLVGVQGRDRLSEYFAFDLDLLSTDFAIQPDDMLGSPATIWIADRSGISVPVNGIICRFARTGRHGTRGLCAYRARLVPALWLLTRTSDCRIFQDQDVREIVDAVLVDYGIEHKSWKLNATYEKREYCVQYRETAYDFVCRLLEEEGIFFYFTHDEHSHTVVFTDHNRGLPPCPKAEIPIAAKAGELGVIWSWQHSWRYRCGRWALSDFNFETPSTSLAAQKNTVNPVLGKRPLEMFDYPGRYTQKSPGAARAQVRIEYEEAAYHEIAGIGAAVGFAAGCRFSLADADASEEGVEYLLTEVEHEAEDRSLVAEGAAPPNYTNRFFCSPVAVPYRPEMKTARPCIFGAQTAIVTGPSGSEICTDKYGRIKVQFHWDRHSRKDEYSSCWIRVAQSWAGAGWGTWYVPRIGQEVVVAFLDGDPDRPLVVGSVYNAEQTVPFALPGNATQSGLRSRSSMGGSGGTCNELRFEDRKGAEQVYLHAERNLAASVELDESHTVGHDRTKSVVNDETTSIGGNRTESVAKNENVQIALARTHSVGTIDTLTVGAARMHTVGAAEAISVGAARTVNVGAMQSIEVGAAQSISVGADQTISVGGNESISVGGNESVSVGKDRTSSIGQNESLSAGKSVSITAGDQITLKTGSATITMKKNGDITIEGKQITIKGSGDVIIKGQKILQN